MKDGEGLQSLIQQKGQVRTGLERGHRMSSKRSISGCIKGSYLDGP